MFKKKRKSFANVELNDYILRALVVKGNTLSDMKPLEIPLDVGMVEEGEILDEMALFHLLADYKAALGGKNQAVRFFAPNASVLLKQVDLPKDVAADEVKEYIQMEIGHSIHLPFHDPLFDVYDQDPNDEKAIIFAAPPSEVLKLRNIFLDNQLQPKVVDIRALSNLRFLHHLDMLRHDKTYILTDWAINSLMICIYSEGSVEFLRYQAIDTSLEDWRPVEQEVGVYNFEYDGNEMNYQLLLTDQVLEIDRLMNFFKFSLHKGEKSVEELIVLGDNPYLSHIVDLLQESFTIPIKVITDEVVADKFPGFSAKYSALLGLAMKGGVV